MNRRRRRISVLESVPTALLSLNVAWCVAVSTGAEVRAQAPAPESPPEEWRQATPGYAYSFPRDHGPHEDYQIEWWYYTGNLHTDDGRAFGYQLTFFRSGISRHADNRSRWAVRHLYFAHFAISDIGGRSFRFFQRINRQGVGWAGATATPNRVWNEDWELTIREGGHHLKAKEGGCGVDLTLSSTKPPIIHGENGVSRKGSRPGNASHYYSLTRLVTEGTLTVDGESLQVRGASWMDHEFGTTFLEEGALGWDWFSLQLKDGRELMLFQIRQKGGGISPYSSGTLVDMDGKQRHLRAGEFRLTPLRTWTSPATNASYPVAWTVEIPDLRLRLDVEATFPGQELRTVETAGVSYWEGAVRAGGTEAARNVEAEGYLEMTGYAGKGMGELFR